MSTVQRISFQLNYLAKSLFFTSETLFKTSFLSVHGRYKMLVEEEAWPAGSRCSLPDPPCHQQ